MNIILTTERLILREMTLKDKTDLMVILSDKETMRCYQHPFSAIEVENWINWNINNYSKYNHGLWAVILKSDNIFIGDCGITIQQIDQNKVPEIGYHINKQYWFQGYATEAANACKEYGFQTLGFNELYSYMTEKNLPSQAVAQKIGMKKKNRFKKNGIEQVVWGLNYQP